MSTMLHNKKGFDYNQTSFFFNLNLFKESPCRAATLKGTGGRTPPAGVLP